MAFQEMEQSDDKARLLDQTCCIVVGVLTGEQANA